MHGRGLKLDAGRRTERNGSVARHARAWIETFLGISKKTRPTVARHARAWIETHDDYWKEAC